MTQSPTYDDLVKFARWTQKFWQEGQEIQRKHGIVIDDIDDKMQKLAFTYYSNLCEIDRESRHLFGEGWGEENYGKEHEIYTPEHDAQVAAKERERVLKEFCNEFWGKPLPESRIDFVERVGEIIRMLRQREQPK